MRFERRSTNADASRRSADSPSAGDVGVVLLLAAGGIVCGIIAMKQVIFEPRSVARQAASWVDTPCTIVRHTCSDLSTNSNTTYTALAWYQYYFEGKAYEAYRLHFGSEGNGKSFGGHYARSRAMTYVQETFPLQLELRCYVNPANPEQAVIERKVVYGWLGIGIGSAFILAGVGLASYLIYKVMQERRRAKGNGQ